MGLLLHFVIFSNMALADLLRKEDAAKLLWGGCIENTKKILFFFFFFSKHKAIKAGPLLLEKIEKLLLTTITTGLQMYIEHTEQENTCSLMALRSYFKLFLFTILDAPPSHLFWTFRLCFSTQLKALCCLMVFSLPHAISEEVTSVMLPRLTWACDSNSVFDWME